jgi:hypothetical protein
LTSGWQVPNLKEFVYHSTKGVLDDPRNILAVRIFTKPDQRLLKLINKKLSLRAVSKHIL